MASQSKLEVLIKARDEVTKVLSNVNSKLQEMKQEMSSVGKTMTILGAASTAATVLSIKNYTEMGDQIHKLSQRINFSTESLSEWGHVLRIGGSDIDSMQMAIKGMASAIVDANDGLTTYQRSFEHLGLSYEDLMDMPVEQQFEAITMALAECKDETLQLALAQDLFGRSGLNLLPAIKQGSEEIARLREEAHELGIVFDQEAANKAAQLKDGAQRLESAFHGLQITLGEALQPVLVSYADSITGILKGINNFAREHEKATEIIANMTVSISLVSAALGALILLLPRVISFANQMGMSFKGFSGIAAGATAGIGMILSGINMLMANSARYDAYLEAREKLIEEQRKLNEGLENSILDAAEAYADALEIYVRGSGMSKERKAELIAEAEAYREEAQALREWHVEYEQYLREVEAAQRAHEALLATVEDMTTAFDYQKTAAAEYGLTMEDVYHHMHELGYTTSQIAFVYDEFGTKAGYVNDILIEYGFTAEQVALSVGKLADETDELIKKQDELNRQQQQLHDSFKNLMHRIHYADSEAAEFNLTMYDIYDAMDELGYSVEEIRQLYMLWGEDIANIDEALDHLGLTAQEINDIINEQTEAIEENTEAKEKNAEATEQAASTSVGEEEWFQRTGVSQAALVPQQELWNLLQAERAKGAEANVELMNWLANAIRQNLWELYHGSGQVIYTPEDIPEYQHGGVISEPTLLYGLSSRHVYAKAGEKGTEYVTPGGRTIQVVLQNIMDGDVISERVFEIAGDKVRLQGITD